MLMIEAHFLGSYIRVKTLIKLKKPFLLSFELDVWDADVLGRWNAHVTFNWESFPLCQLFFYTCCWCPVSKCQIQFNCQTNKPQKPGPCAPAASCLEGHIPLSFRWSWFNCTSMWEYKKGKRRGHFAETLLLSPTGCRCHFEWMREKWLDLELTTGGGLG